MPTTPLSNLQLITGSRNEEDLPPEIEVDIAAVADGPRLVDGIRETELPDGSVEIDLAPKAKDGSPATFNANLALHMEEADLNRIASDLLEGIERDNQSRSQHLEMLAEGMKLLGLVIESNTSGAATTSAPLEGMSTVRHPLLLEACQLFQANAMGEILPAAGPVKVRDDRPQKPQGLMGHNGGPPLNDANPFDASGIAAAPGAPPPATPPVAGAPPVAIPPIGMEGQSLPGAPPVPPPLAPQGPAAGIPAPAAEPVEPPPQPGDDRDKLADALEKDFNHYLTVIAKEYVPDTDQMLFKVGFGGLGIKKVYNCPVRRRPVSESVDIEDFIVSNALTDLSNAGRITQRIKMRPSTLKRMQILNVYRDVPLSAPQASESPNAVDQAKAEVQGVQPQVQDPKDADHEIYECYCELDLDEYAPPQFKGKGLCLPYRVTIEKESQKVLEIRRNWKEDDNECMAKEFFVDFPYMRAFGFYCIGLLHLLGNTTKALTALWREFIDAGMFANFPGFLYLKGAGRQLTNQFRVAPGTGAGVDASVTDIRQAVMPLPYKNPDAGFVAFVQHVEDLGTRLGGTANTAVSEGRADAPVGTTLALIEQATKPVGAVNKRLHQSQQRELWLLKERFKDDPEAFWRFNKRPAMAWEKAQFVAALNDYDLVPVSDPNNPTRMHRMAKAEAFKGVVAAAPQFFDQKKAILKYSSDMGIAGVEETMIKGDPPPQQGDPAKMAQVEQQTQKAQLDLKGKEVVSAANLQEQAMEMQDRAAERQNRLQVAQVNLQSEQVKLAASVAIHSDKADSTFQATILKLLNDREERVLDRQHDHQMAQAEHERSKELAKDKPQKEAAE